MTKDNTRDIMNCCCTSGRICNNTAISDKVIWSQW